MRATQRTDLPDNVIPFRRTGAPGTGRHPSGPTTLLAAEIVGWDDVLPALGLATALDALAKATDAAVETIGHLGGAEIMIEGTLRRPAVFAIFTGRRGPIQAVTAAASIRVAIARVQSPADPTQLFRAATGLDTALVTEGRTADGVAFMETGILRASATRLRDFAQPGQIFFTDATLSSLGDAVTVQPLGLVEIGDAGGSRQAFNLTTLN